MTKEMILKVKAALCTCDLLFFVSTFVIVWCCCLSSMVCVFCVFSVSIVVAVVVVVVVVVVDLVVVVVVVVVNLVVSPPARLLGCDLCNQ